MKKAFAVILAAVLLMVAGACSRNEEPTVSDSAAQPAAALPQTENVKRNAADALRAAYTPGNKRSRENNMEYGFDSIIGLDKLDLSYEAHLEGIDGENFTYSVYFENGVTDEHFGAVEKAVIDFVQPYETGGVFLGYIDVSKADDNICVYLDLGNTDEGQENTAIHGILTALNGVEGIKSVIINEGMGFDF